MDGSPIYYVLYNGPPLPLRNCSFPWEDLDPHLVHGSFIALQFTVYTPNGMSIGSVVFARLTIVTDRQTDRPRYCIYNNRPHLPM